MTNDEKFYTSAVNAFRQNNDVRALELFLMIPNYNDSGEYIEEILKDPNLKEKLYLDAVDKYKSHNYIKALEHFKWIEEYKDSKEYMMKIKKKLEPKPVSVVKNDKTNEKIKSKSNIFVLMAAVVSFIMMIVICILLPIKESYFIVSKNNIGTMFLLLAIVILASICFFEIINMFVPLKKNEDPKNKLVSLKNILRVSAFLLGMGLIVFNMFTMETYSENEFKTVAKNVPAVFSIVYIIILSSLFVSTFYYEISTNQYIYNNFNKKIPKIILILVVVFSVIFNMIETMIYDKFSLISGFGLLGIIAYGFYLIVDFVTDEFLL